MGLEGSGIVKAVGSSVRNVSIGDRVMYLAGGCFTTHILVPSVLCVKIDDSMSFEMGAAVPCVYTTALLALVDKANLRKGQVSSNELTVLFSKTNNRYSLFSYNLHAAASA